MKTLILTAILVGAIGKSFTTWPIFIAAIVITALIAPEKAPRWWLARFE